MAGDNLPLHRLNGIGNPIDEEFHESDLKIPSRLVTKRKGSHSPLSNEGTRINERSNSPYNSGSPSPPTRLLSPGRMNEDLFKVK